MPCIPLPPISIPELPAPFTLGFETPPVDFDPALCCKLLPFPIAVPPLPLGIELNPAITAALRQVQKTIQDYIDSLPPPCARE